LLELARSSFESSDNRAWLEWGSLLLPQLLKVVEAEAEVTEREERKRQKEEQCAAIMTQFKTDQISGKGAGAALEKLDSEFGPDEAEPEPEHSANDDEPSETDDNIPPDDNFESRMGTQAR